MKYRKTDVQTCTLYIYCTGHKDTQTYRRTDIQADRQTDTERHTGRKQANMQ
jgi:hypothetical protein